MLVLLDLNFTLARVEYGDKRPLSKRIPEETYRAWIPPLCKRAGARVVITTARPERHREATLDRILEQLRWQPEASFFSQGQGMPPQLKEANLHRIIDQYGRPNNNETGQWVGFESNPRTRDMYTRYGIYSIPVPRDDEWSHFPELPAVTVQRSNPFALP